MVAAQGRIRLHPQERVIYGVPADQAVAEELDRWGARRAFVTSARSLARLEDGPLQRVVAALGDRCAGVFDQVSAHSPEEEVVAAAAAARAAGADALVAVGGGSVIDATKAVQMCLWEDVTSVQGLRGLAERYGPGGAQAPGGELRMISVSTTLSAAEFTPNAGILNREAGAKTGFSSPWLVPRAAVLDPAATKATPMRLLLSTGMRAMDHAAEAWGSRSANPMTDLYALGAAQRLARALPAIKATPGAVGARQAAQFGMWQAILALTGGAGSGASHAVGYALGAGFGVPHGETSCVMLPAVLRWNAETESARQRGLAAALGDAKRPAWALMGELVGKLGLPRGLRDVGVAREDLPRLAELALAYKPMRRNPRPVNSVEDVREILELAWEGRE